MLDQVDAMVDPFMTRQSGADLDLPEAPFLSQTPVDVHDVLLQAACLRASSLAPPPRIPGIRTAIDRVAAQLTTVIGALLRGVTERQLRVGSRSSLPR